jgi:RHS repeat-associated protein
LTASTGSLVNPFQYTARESDSETGLYYYRARYYDSLAGRFISEDPVEFVGGPNFYAYVQANPINLNDPSGLKFEVAGDWKSFWDAIRYLSRDPGMAQIIKKLADSDTVYKITTNSGGQDVDFFGDVNWDPHGGSKCVDAEGAAMSPALLLGHELGHVSHGWYPRFRDGLHFTYDAYDNLEEQKTIEQIENPAARTLGEGIRTDHRGKIVHVQSPRTVPSCACSRAEQSGKPAL